MLQLPTACSNPRFLLESLFRIFKSQSNFIVSCPAQLLSLFLFLLALLSNRACALPSRLTPPSYSQNLSVNLPPWAQGRLFAISDSAPFAHHLQNDPDYVLGLGIVNDFFAAVQEEINLNRISRNSTGYSQPCNVRPESWHRATHNAAVNRGWPVSKVNGSICITDYHGIPASFSLRSERFLEAIGEGFAAVNRYAYRIMLDTVGNWTSIGEDAGLPIEFPSQICDLKNYGGFRLSGKWWAAVGVTNEPANFHVPDGKRISIGEIHRTENGTVVSALMTLPINPGTGEEHSVTDRATTIITTWGGAVNAFSRFEPSTAHENVGLKAAVAKGSNVAQQMEDVILASNTAILAFPLVLNLVPGSLFTRYEKWKAVMYILLSDILTAMPMFIKGIELWSIGNARFTEIVTRMGDTLEEETIGVEMWVATCRVRHNVQTVGTIFITVASLAMAVGVGLEVIARSLMLRASKKRELEIDDIQALEQFEGAGWKHFNEVSPSGRWMMQNSGSSIPLRPIHDTWVPMPTRKAQVLYPNSTLL
ncbi:hypothetical protein FGB62_3g360 [Gracilaria domingensis]|nr:hypothetical protein FGB62_3g360 [Gracilaria domingensis]